MIKYGMNPRKTIYLLLMITLSFGLISCNYAKLQDDESRDYSITDFDRLYVKGNFTIYLVQSDSVGMSIEGFKESLATIDVQQSAGSNELRLVRDKFSLSSPQVTIRYKNLEELRIEGGANVTTEGYADLNDLNVRVEGGANLKLKLKVNQLKLRGEGGVVYQLEGVAQKVESTLIGAAYIKASDFSTDTAIVRIEGVGIADLNVNKYLNATVEGMGAVSYKGDPEVDKSIQGLGKISQE